MIGTRASATIWLVDYRFEKVSRLVLADRTGTGERRDQVDGKAFVLSADPTGRDLCDVAEAMVLGKEATPEHRFTLTHVHRVADACGLVQLEERKQ